MNDTNTSPTASKPDDTRLLKVLLMVGGLFCLAAGAVQFFFPGIDAILADVQPGELDWIYRLLGSGYIGLGIGMLRVSRKLNEQGMFIDMLIVMAGLVCVTFTVTLVTASYQPIPAILTVWIAAFVLLLYARWRARDIL